MVLFHVLSLSLSLSLSSASLISCLILFSGLGGQKKGKSPPPFPSPPPSSAELAAGGRDPPSLKNMVNREMGRVN